MVKSLAAKKIQSNVHQQTKMESNESLNHSGLIFKLTAQLSKLASVY